MVWHSFTHIVCALSLVKISLEGSGNILRTEAPIPKCLMSLRIMSADVPKTKANHMVRHSIKVEGNIQGLGYYEA